MRYWQHVLFCLVFLAGCNTNHAEYSVYPIPKEFVVVQGQESFIAIMIKIPANHHIYGNPKGPGIGKPTEVFIRSSEDIRFGLPQYLPPKKMFYPGEKEHTWGYDEDTKIFVPFTVSAKAAIGPHIITITVDALLCNDTPGGGITPAASACTPKIVTYSYYIRIMPQGSVIFHHTADLKKEFTLSKPSIVTDYKQNAYQILTKTKSDDHKFTDLKFFPRFIETGITGIIHAILFGIIAGFLLNFMPCVLPVVSLKVMSFVKHADKNKKELIVLSLLFSLGIITSFALLASLAAFLGYRWGGLFQHKIFLIAMTGIVFALALSLFGVYTINIPSIAGKAASDKENHYADAYFKGLLATLLATPCSGPFLGGTLAWTLSQTPAVIFIVFMSIGVGMALPYVILTMNPKLIKVLPKPGEWIKTFEQVMGFLLIFTIIYLLGIFDTASIMPMIFFLGCIALGLWQYGRYGALYQTALKRIASIILLAAIIISGYVLSYHYIYAEKETIKMQGSDFSIERIMENKKSGRISLVEFTADWCPNCKLVETLSLHTKAVTETVRDNNIDFIIADITRKNTQAERLLALFQSQSIPLLAVIPPGSSFEKPIILRDIYSEKDVLRAIETVKKDTSSDNSSRMKYQMEMPDSILKKQ